MKSLPSRVAAILLGTASLCAAGAANAVIVFSDDFTDGDISDWTPGFVNVIDSGAGDTAGQRITVIDANNRIELFDVETIGSAPQSDFSVRSTNSFDVSTPSVYDVSYLVKTTVCVGCDSNAEVFVDGVLQQTFLESGVFTARSFEVFLDAGLHTISLGLHVPDTLFIGPVGAFFDDVVIAQSTSTSVPEPGGSGLLWLGVAALGLAGRGLQRRGSRSR